MTLTIREPIERKGNIPDGIEPIKESLRFSTYCTPITKFPERVRVWPHPGITIDLTSRAQFRELNNKGNQMIREPRYRGMPIEIAGPMIFKELFENLFWSTDRIATSAFGMDRITYEEACDYVERNWIHIPLSSLSIDQFSSMLQKIHHHIIDPENPSLKGFPPGKYRTGTNEPGTNEMVVWKIPELFDQPFVVFINQKIAAAQLLPNAEEIKAKLREAHKEMKNAALQGYSLYEMVNLNKVSPYAKALINEIYILYPPNKHIVPLMEKMISQIIEKLIRYENRPDEVEGPLPLKERVEQLTEDAISIASFAHLKLVGIHPFSEANGRMARMLMNIILMQAGHQPVGFTHDKPYTQALRTEDAGHKGAFDTFIRKTIKESTPIPLYVVSNQRRYFSLYKEQLS